MFFAASERSESDDTLDLRTLASATQVTETRVTGRPRAVRGHVAPRLRARLRG